MWEVLSNTFQLTMASSLGIGRSVACVLEWSNNLGLRASGWREGVPYGELPKNTLITATREAADDYQS